MLAYLDALIAALAARNLSEIDRLLAHPLARILSSDALADATAERRAAGTGAPSVAPLRLLQFRYLTAQLLGSASGLNAGVSGGDTTRGADGRCSPSKADRGTALRRQMELSLSA